MKKNTGKSRQPKKWQRPVVTILMNEPSTDLLANCKYYGGPTPQGGAGPSEITCDCGLVSAVCLQCNKIVQFPS